MLKKLEGLEGACFMCPHCGYSGTYLGDDGEMANLECKSCGFEFRIYIGDDQHDYLEDFDDNDGEQDS